MGNLKLPKEFELLPSDIMYLTNTFDSNANSGYKQCQLIAKAKKDAWNAAIRCADESCEFYCDK